MTNSYNKNFKKGYNHKEWIELLNAIINFLMIFGAIINLIIFAFCGFNVAGITSFFSYLLVGASKLTINLISYFNPKDKWKN